ncbi:hypothetical protein A2715_03560 [Candidatus Woesebacteria bacterium RIFCSPHIGHO2_01_FULL_39_32]|uniref:Uncharacterized protein n=1 Tax=Candidatus Woesebacteria bacterium RIFCSPLOWO2_01_FULL_39_25 TaxID=1802521 RepID=A0A1F8BKS6_9BACT|nr:MAG: hypothetical protein A2715_03560 [Candidatus Woesebacteria bacterium RIFCSPHIGHO2_01_FULL_39_32]OGM37138.1 MAG: hypothetical protein A3F01_05500 [Candidatus Woesebacteria bacterium RIFCSPHIGHO2_12_FULL_38_11]OGM64643.1 MAG: hypothetical protein A2893_06475 [Candidatus Woesebacteria bacterium RIFCSPLOWO2_01_FULL_39_25]
MVLDSEEIQAGIDVAPRPFYNRLLTEGEWQGLIREGRGAVIGKFPGYISCLARISKDKVASGLFPKGTHADVLIEQKGYFGLGELDDSKAAAVLLERESEYELTGAQLWFDSKGVVEKLDYNISTDFLRAKEVKAISTDILGKVPEPYVPKLLEIRLGDEEHSSFKRPSYYVMMRQQDGSWNIMKAGKRKAWGY